MNGLMNPLTCNYFNQLQEKVNKTGVQKNSASSKGLTEIS